MDVKFRKLSILKKLRKMTKRVARDNLLWVCLPMLYRAASKMPVDERKVVFVEAKLKKMPDAFKSLWRWLELRYDFDLHYLSLNQNASGFRTYEKNCEKLVAEIATARYVILNDASDVLSCLPLRPETRVLQLWHAPGAFKKWGMSTADLKFGGSRKQKRRHPYYENLDLVTVSSPEVAWAYREAMDLEDRPALVRALGVSRTDIYFDSNFVVSARERVEANFPACKGKKIIAYVPTFRGHVKTAKGPRQLDVAALQRVLSDGYVLLIKHHPFVKKPPKIAPECESFAFQVGNKVVIETLLSAADVCITDYSSVVFDFSLLDRPIAFFAPDRAEYEQWRGFYYDYEELACGPVFEDSDELANWVVHADELYDAPGMAAFRARFMNACDGHATERIAHAFFGGELDVHLSENVVASWKEEDPSGKDVSIVIPAFNAETTLSRALESVLAQTYSRERMEVIVVDDSSTDRTSEVAQRYATAYPRLVRLARTARPSGSPSEPRNIGLSMARGRYVFFLDSDDWIGEQAVWRMLGHAFEWGSDVVVVKMRGHNGRAVPAAMFKDTVADVDIYRSKLMWTLSPLKLFRRELVKDLRFPDFMPEDMSFVLRALVGAEVVSIASDYDYYHVTYEPEKGGNISTTSWDDVDSNMRAYEDLFSFIGEHVPEGQGEHTLLKRILRRDVVQTFLAIARQGKGGEGQYDRLLELTGRYYLPSVYQTCPIEKRIAQEAAFTWGFDSFLDFAQKLGDDSVPPFDFLAYDVSPDSVLCKVELAGCMRTVEVLEGVRLRAAIVHAVREEDGLLVLEGSLDSSHLFRALSGTCHARIVAKTLDGEERRSWSCAIRWEEVSRDIQLDRPASGFWSAVVNVADLASETEPSQLAGNQAANRVGNSADGVVWGLFLELEVDGFEKAARLSRSRVGNVSSLGPFPVSDGASSRLTYSLERARGGFAFVGRSTLGHSSDSGSRGVR